MKPFVFACQECETAVPDARARYVVRHEIVRQDVTHRLAVKTERYLCRSCAENLAANWRGPETSVTQPSML